MTDYCTLTQVKNELRITDQTDDTLIAERITSASQRIDRDTGRPHGFGKDSGTTQRIYLPRHETLLSVDDIATATGLVVEVGKGTTWSGIDSSLWDTLPENGPVDGWAIEQLRRLLGSWPMWGTQRIRVTATFGWPAIPTNIENAAILLCTRLVRRRDSPEGVHGFNDLGVIRISRYDPDYDSLIGPYVRDIH